ncbi:hypothetical protein [Ureibacillus manganicus]|uniref:hypothetical protein n=1 Tax=Ureibacillus manganicus TaxID=1266064 RepID=UPI00068FD597|nr:hypothetical protein [Ureibacillus manganicus]
MKSKWIITLVVLVFMLFGCGTGEQTNGNSSNYDIENVTEGIIEDGQFSFKLTSEKAVYQVGEPLQIQAVLTYIGDQASITISHAASPIWLLTTNLTEDYQFQAAMNEPLIFTELKKDVPLIEEYQFSGGTYYDGAPGKPYSDEVFMQIAEGKFPPGQYEIKGRTDFAVGEDISVNTVNLETSIIFTVIE